MNPGALSFIILVIFAVLFVTGWGRRYFTESRMGEKMWFVLLLAIGLASSLDLRWNFLQINLSAALFALLLALYLFGRLTWRQRIYFLVCLITTTSLVLILMTLVPHDPAFYLIDANYLYPLSAILSAYTFSRRPLFTLAVASTGILLAGMIHECQLSFATSGVVVFGSPELFDLISIAFLFGFLMDQALHLIDIAITKISRNPERNLEGDPT